MAVKRMNITRQQRRELLFNEAVVIKGLRHPNIVSVFGSHLGKTRNRVLKLRDKPSCVLMLTTFI